MLKICLKLLLLLFSPSPLAPLQVHIIHFQYTLYIIYKLVFKCTKIHKNSSKWTDQTIYLDIAYKYVISTNFIFDYIQLHIRERKKKIRINFNSIYLNHHHSKVPNKFFLWFFFNFHFRKFIHFFFFWRKKWIKTCVFLRSVL